MSSTYLTRTQGTATNRKKWTISTWFKLAHYTNDAHVFSIGDSGSVSVLYISNTGLVRFYGSADSIALYPTRQLRDFSGWYSVVLAFDSTQSTSSDRLKMYINGVQETSFSTATYPTLNSDSDVGISGEVFKIGMSSLASDGYFSGSMSHFHFVDGTAYPASTFGSTDATTGEWKINTSPTVTYGDNGFFVLKDGNSVTDQSGEGNNFTVGGGTLTNTEDCPSDVFATINPLGSGAVTFSNGNNTVTKSGSGWLNAITNLGASAGKYYAEAKAISIGSVTYGSYTGFVNLDVSNKQNTAINIGEGTDSAGISSGGGYIYYNGTQFAGPTTATTNGDIVNLAMDLDNGRLYWGINGTYVNSGVPTSGATGTGGMPIANLTADGTYTFGQSIREGANYSWNFGNGYFGTTAISSEGTNASNIGKFEYDVPTGYTALSTKGFNK